MKDSANPLCSVGLFLTFILPVDLALAQGDPHRGSVVFVEAGPEGCPPPAGQSAPRLDPAHFPPCWMPPNLCPPREVAAENGTAMAIPFDQLPPGAPCLLLFSPPQALPLIAPCHWAGHGLLGIAVSTQAGTAQVGLVLPSFGAFHGPGVVPLGIAQLVALDVASHSRLPVAATSRVLLVEARF